MAFSIDLAKRALALARRGEGHTRPNPPVGAIVYRGTRILGEGWHRKAGGDHAEVAALKKCRESAKGASLIVTLEPCSRAGRVGACTDAIIAAGIREVYYLAADPNPTNHGRAKRVLSRAGITCESVPDQEAARLIAPFAKYVRTGLPYVTVKIAMSLDGRICDDAGDAKWISSAKMRRATGLLRNRVDAILVGAETVRKDNPTLLPHQGVNRDLVRAVVSRSGQLPPHATVLTDGKNPTLVFPDVESALRKLGQMGLTHVLCEGGLKLAVALAEAGFVDEWLAVMTPKVIGTRPISQVTIIPQVKVMQDFEI